MDSSDKEAAILIVCSVVIGLSLFNLTNLPETDSSTEVLNIATTDQSVLLHTGCHRLEMGVSSQQAESIRLGLSNETFFRPLTHDLALNLTAASGNSIEKININGFENNTYTANIILENGEKVDTRPSDGIALAVRADTPVTVDRTVLHRQAQFLCDHYV